MGGSGQIGRVVYWSAGSLHTLHSDSLMNPRGVAIDHYKGGRVYWSDERLIMSILPDGSDRRMIADFNARTFYLYLSVVLT